MGDNNQLKGWGLIVYSSGDTREAVWNGQGEALNLMRNVNAYYNGVEKIEENGREVFGRRDYTNGEVKYIVDENRSSTFNEEADNFAKAVYMCTIE